MLWALALLATTALAQTPAYAEATEKELLEHLSR